MPAPERPLGLFLAGGGALGAWQAAALERLVASGVSFDRVMGFSIGAFNAASLAFGRLDETLRQWRGRDGGVLKLALKVWPHFSLLSDEAVRGLLDIAADDEGAKPRLRIPLCVIGANIREGCAEYAEFAPGGKWHGPLEAWLRASAAIPGVFPPVRIGSRVYVDGGVPMPTPMHFDFFADCREVWVLEMVRPEEVGMPKSWNPYYSLDIGGRQSSRWLVDQGVASLATRPVPPKVRRLCPSRRLDSVMLDFSKKSLAPMFALGAQDADDFLKQ